MIKETIAEARYKNPMLAKAEGRQSENARRALSLLPQHLGAQGFRERYDIRYAYVCGAMYKGIASAELVIRLGQYGLMGILGTGGVALEKVESDLEKIQKSLGQFGRYGINLLHDLNDQEAEMRRVALYLRCGVQCLEAAAFMQITKALVWFRVTGIHISANGGIECRHRIIAKVSRPEVAEAFLSPSPKKIIDELLNEKKITYQQAIASEKIPVASDICVEADSGGHTDQGVASVIFPAIERLTNQLVEHYGFQDPVHVGLAGGIGTPESAAAAFVLGADFIVTGSINQCTIEAATSDAVKDLLQDMGIQDTDYAPAGDMFEIGARVQVLKKGVFFSARSNRLFDLYSRYDSWESIPLEMRNQLEAKYFRQSFDEVFARVIEHYQQTNRFHVIEKANADARKKLALVFRWYFWKTTQLALTGDEKSRVDFQIHTGPALGAFNQWVKGTPLQSWRNRHVDDIAEQLMQGAAAYLRSWIQRFNM